MTDSKRQKFPAEELRNLLQDIGSTAKKIGAVTDDPCIQKTSENLQSSCEELNTHLNSKKQLRQ